MYKFIVILFLLAMAEDCCAMFGGVYYSGASTTSYSNGISPVSMAAEFHQDGTMIIYDKIASQSFEGFSDGTNLDVFATRPYFKAISPDWSFTVEYSQLDNQYICGSSQDFDGAAGPFYPPSCMNLNWLWLFSGKTQASTPMVSNLNRAGSSSLTVRVGSDSCNRRIKAITVRPMATSNSDNYQGMRFNGVGFDAQSGSWNIPFEGAPGTNMTLTPESASFAYVGISNVGPVFDQPAQEILSFTADKYTFDPEMESVTLNGTFSSSVSWTLKVADKVVSGTGGGAQVDWDGKDAKGHYVAPGSYVATLTIRDCDQDIDSRSVTITIPPCSISIQNLALNKGSFDPASGEILNIFGVINSTKNYTWSTNVGGGGQGLPPGGAFSASWDGKTNSALAAEGRHRITVTAKSPRGFCISESSVDVVVKKGPQGMCPFEVGSTAHPATGNLSFEQDLFRIKGKAPLGVTLSYDSLASRSGPVSEELIQHYKKALQLRADGTIEYWNGSISRLYVPSEGGFSSPDDSVLQAIPDGTFLLDDIEGSVTTFYSTGKVGSVTDAGGRHYSYSYSNGSVAATEPNGVTKTFSSLYYSALNPVKAPISHGWSHNYAIGMQDQGDGALMVKEGASSRLYIQMSGVFASPPGDFSNLVKNADGTFTLAEKDGRVKIFDASGRIQYSGLPSGVGLTFIYTDGLLTSVTAGGGREVRFSYSPDMKLSEILDPEGNRYIFAYENGGLAVITNPDEGQWKFAYDADGFLTTRTDPGGATTTYTYDSSHRVIIGTDAEGRTRNIDYAVPATGTLKTTTLQEKDGGEWQYTYDSTTGTLTAKTDPLGNITSYTYDSRKNMLTKTEPPIGTSRYSYDEFDNLTSYTDPLGNITTYTYNQNGQILTTAGPAGTTSNTYDINGNILSTTEPGGATTTYRYDERGNLLEITDANSNATNLEYDAYDMLVSSTDATGAKTTFTYDLNGNVLTETDAAGHKTTFEYDGKDRAVKITNPAGAITAYEYDKMGNRTAVVDGNGKRTSYKYNSRGQVVEAKDALGNVTAYTYGATGCTSCGGGVDKLTALADSKGQVTRFEYDSLGRLTQETDPLQKIRRYGYDPAGNLDLKTKENGSRISYQYDPLRRLTAKSYPDGSSVIYSYDNASRVVIGAYRDISYSYEYDDAGRVKTVTDSRGYKLTYEYDNLGKRTKMTLQSGNADARITSYSYDAAGRLRGLTSPAGAFTFTYDSLGRRTASHYPNVVDTTYSFDAVGRLTRMDFGLSPLPPVEYQYDSVGNRFKRTTAETEQYIYDEVYRLLSVSSGKPESFNYDPLGNRQAGPGKKDTGYLANSGNQIAQGRKLSYTYDDSGNQSSKIVPFAMDKTWTQFWDYDDRLVKVEKVKGAEKRTVSFNYDHLGRRIGKVFTTIKAGVSKTVSWSYVYDGDNIIIESYMDASGNVTKTYFTQGLGADEHLALERDGQTFFYHADGLGSVIAITDGNGNPVQKYAYDSFGGVTPSTNFVNSYTYTGREWDKETGLYYYRARYYDPMEGKFISKDPIDFKGGDSNLYGYTKNNPINFSDPTGNAGLSLQAGAQGSVYYGGGGVSFSCGPILGGGSNGGGGCFSCQICLRVGPGFFAGAGYFAGASAYSGSLSDSGGFSVGVGADIGAGESIGGQLAAGVDQNGINSVGGQKGIKGGAGFGLSVGVDFCYTKSVCKECNTK